MTYTKISKKERDYLILIFELSRDFPVRVRDIAEATNVSEPTAYEYSVRLAEKGLVLMKKGIVKLTEKGNETVSSIIKAHRVLETLFYINGISADESCQECSKIDYLLDKETIDKLYRKLGEPANCPHGKPVVVESS
ncbi:MAG: metal-dependent transcriptional regulator [Nitrososphaeria archaeon]|nr:metal-dependent transcriptional regulator [Conexivisphaerales archaeon]